MIFCFLDGGNHDASLHSVNSTITILERNFNVTWWAIVPIALLFICAWVRIPTVSTLFIDITVSIVMIFIKHPHFGLTKINKVIVNGFQSTTGHKAVDSLLSRGGIMNMMSTVSLVIIALALGGLLMHLGIIKAVMTPLVRHLHRTGSLIIAVILSGIGVNVFIGEQYSSVILPAAAFNEAFKKHGLAPVALSRALEDGGTVINYLVPWGVAGAFVANALNVPVLHYLPFVFFSLLSPVFSIISGVTGIGIKHSKKN
ncbi:MAG: Hypothetical protein AJITA_00511 [Acetilactobacillus jinshanensis]